jgi:phosphatidylglycerophosphate synthase
MDILVGEIKAALFLLIYFFGLIILYFLVRALFLNFNSVKTTTKTGKRNTLLFCIIISLVLTILFHFLTGESEIGDSIVGFVLCLTATLIARYRYYKRFHKNEALPG